MVVRTVGFENKTLKNSKERHDFVPVFNNTDLTEGGDSVIRKAALPFRSYSTLSMSQLSVYEADKTYPKGVMVKSPEIVYVSLADGNVGNSLEEPAWWKELSSYAGYEPGGIGLEGAVNSGLGLASGGDCYVSQAGGLATGVMSKVGEDIDVHQINTPESGVIVYTLVGDHTTKLTDTYRLVILATSGPSTTEYWADPEDIVSIYYDAGRDYTYITFTADADVPVLTEGLDNISVLNNVAQTIGDVMAGVSFNAGCAALGVACTAKGGGSLASGIMCSARKDASQAFGLSAFNVCVNSLSHSGGYALGYPSASHMVKLYCVTETPGGGDLQLLDWTTLFGDVVYKGPLSLGLSSRKSVAVKITMHVMAVTQEAGLILSEKHVVTFMLTRATGGIVAPLNHVSGFDEDYKADPYSEVVAINYDLDNNALLIQVRHSMTLGAAAHWMADLDIKYMGIPVAGE